MGHEQGLAQVGTVAACQDPPRTTPRRLTVMTTVWVVVERMDYHGAEVVAVFDTEAAADAWATERNTSGAAIDHAEVESWSLNTPDSERKAVGLT
jgi:hypothetical protein